MPDSDDWAVRVFHCGLKKFCCQSSNLTGSCCDKSGKEGGKFSITSVGTPTVLPEESATKSASVLFAAAEVPSPSTITVTKPLTISSSNQAFFSRNTSSSSTTQQPAKPSTSSPAKQPEHTLSTTQPPTKPPIPRPNNQPEQSSNAEPTSKGLIAALSLTSGILAIAALAYAFRRSRKKRRLKQKNDSRERKVQDRPPAFIPPLVETNGYTEWEMGTNGNTHEAPASETWPESESS
ncbi:MAG: hypothetical protein Q9228_003898 [Teloschistes exilis]